MELCIDDSQTNENNVEYNDFSPDFLRNLSEKISQMSTFNHIEILKLLLSKEYNRELINDNKSGIHINLTILDNDTINEIVKYTKYVAVQELELSRIENQKQTFRDTYFNNS